MKNVVNSDFAYDFIRKRILNGEYRPGQALMTNVLATDIHVSRTPIRDALRQLEADGLVTIRPRLGASVKAMELKEFRDLCGLRLALESYAAGLAAAQRTEADLHEIGAALAALRDLTERFVAAEEENRSLTELAREDVRFHIAIMTAGRNDLIKKEILRLHLINRVVSWLNPGTKDKPLGPEKADLDEHRRVVQQEHEQIAEAIQRGDPAAARAAMKRHLSSIFENSLRNMARAEDRLISRELTKEELSYRP